MHIRTGLNVRHADQQVRGAIVLPHGLGKEMTVAVFAKGDKAREAEEAGADLVGAEDLAERVEGGFADFDVAIATPDMMRVVGKLGRILGPRGLMPNPKVGTVTMDVARPSPSRRPARSNTAPTVTHRAPAIGERASTDRSCSRLRGADRRDRARQAGGGEGPRPAERGAHHKHGPGSRRSTRRARGTGSWRRPAAVA